jgi:hypothetical protein
VNACRRCRSSRDATACDFSITSSPPLPLSWESDTLIGRDLADRSAARTEAMLDTGRAMPREKAQVTRAVPTCVW